MGLGASDISEVVIPVNFGLLGLAGTRCRMANHIMSMPKNVGMSHLRASGVTATSSGLPTPPARSALQQFELPTGSYHWLQKPLVDCSVAMCLSINRFLMQVGFFGTMLSPPSHRFLL